MDGSQTEGRAEGEAMIGPFSEEHPLYEAVVEAIRTVHDPEIPVNIYELGLIYELAVDQNGHARVVMTLTSPHCPVAESLPAEVKQKIAAMDGIQHVDLDITWDPPWGQEKMSEAAKLALGMI